MQVLKWFHNSILHTCTTCIIAKIKIKIKIDSLVYFCSFYQRRNSTHPETNTLKCQQWNLALSHTRHTARASSGHPKGVYTNLKGVKKKSKPTGRNNRQCNETMLWKPNTIMQASFVYTSTEEVNPVPTTKKVHKPQEIKLTILKYETRWNYRERKA